MKKLSLFTVFLIAMAISCQKDDSFLKTATNNACQEGLIKVRLVDESGFDGCSWLFMLSDTINLEPINLNSFNIPLIDGEKYWIIYHDVIKAISKCSGREMIKIVNLIDQYSPHSDYDILDAGYQLLELKDLKGKNGCGFVFRKILKGNLEPVNINDFLINYISGKKYWLKYEIADGYASICMTGDMIRILCIKERE